MQNVWDYGDIMSDTGDITGYDVEAVDGSIGRIDATSNAVDSAHIVVDTGFWIFGKKRLIPAGVIDRVDSVQEKVYVAMSKDQIREAPDYSTEWTDDTTVRSSYADYFGQFGRPR
jgi:hypothetical protein